MLYQVLGTRKFQHFLFHLEKRRNKRTGRKNPNYHLSSISEAGIQRYMEYLYYNAAIHVSGCFLILLYMLIAHWASVFPPVLILALVFLFILNLYCVILQRYNFLRLQSFLIRRTRRNSDWIVRNLSCVQERAYQVYGCMDIGADLRRIQDLIDGLNSDSFVHICPDSIPALMRWNQLLDGITRPVFHEKPVKFTLADALVACYPSTILWDQQERRAAFFQKHFHASGRPVSGSQGIVTDNPEAERLLRILFPIDELDDVLNRLTLLKLSMERSVSSAHVPDTAHSDQPHPPKNDTL